MKKLSGVLKMLLLCCMLICVSFSHAQTVKQQKITEAQLKELDKAPALTNYSDKISSTQKQQGREHAQLLMTYFYKAVLHRSNKTKYLADNNNLVEKRMIEVVSGLSSDLYEKANGHVLAALADKTKKDKYLGKYSEVVFAGKPLAEQLRAKGRDWKVAEVKTQKLKETLPVNFLLSGLYCVDETDPENGNDDIIVSGMFLSGGNDVSGGAGIFCGRFDDGDYATVNDHNIGAVQYAWKENYPQTYYAIIVLLEADDSGNETEEANMLDDVLATAASALESSDTPVTVPMMEESAAIFASLFFDDDLFKPYAIKIELKAANDIYVNDSKVVFNGNVTDGWASGFINGFDGRYQVKLKFKK